MEFLLQSLDLLGGDVPRHVRGQAIQKRQRLGRDDGGRQSAGLALEQSPRLDQFQGADFWLGRVFRVLWCGAHIDARSLPRFDQTLEFQGDHRIADGRTADAEIVGQLALGWQLVAGGVAAPGNGGGDLPGDLLVQLLHCGARIHDELNLEWKAHRRADERMGKQCFCWVAVGSFDTSLAASRKAPTPKSCVSSLPTWSGPAPTRCTQPNLPS